MITTVWLIAAGYWSLATCHGLKKTSRSSSVNKNQVSVFRCQNSMIEEYRDLGIKMTEYLQFLNFPADT
jgi:hypothetical protein